MVFVHPFVRTQGKVIIVGGDAGIIVVVIEVAVGVDVGTTGGDIGKCLVLKILYSFFCISEKILTKI